MEWFQTMGAWRGGAGSGARGAVMRHGVAPPQAPLEPTAALAGDSEGHPPPAPSLKGIQTFLQYDCGHCLQLGWWQVGRWPQEIGHSP